MSSAQFDSTPLHFADAAFAALKKESNFAYTQCKSIRFANIETYHKFIKRKFSKTGNFLFFRKKKVFRKRKYFDKNKRGILYKNISLQPVTRRHTDKA